MKYLAALLVLLGIAAPAAARAQAAPPPAGAPLPPAPRPPPSLPPGPPPPWWLEEEEIPYEPGVPGPPGWLYREEVSKGLVIGGSVSFGASYVLGAFFAGIELESTNEKWGGMFVPVVGPAITSALVDASTAGTFLLVADSVVQAAGLGMFILGMTEPDGSWINPSLRVGAAPGGMQLSGSF